VLAENSLPYNTIGQLHGPGKLTALDAVIEFVKSHLEQLADFCKKATIDNEKALNDRLCLLLNAEANRGSFPFVFQKDDMENLLDGNSPSVDIGVYNVEAQTLEKLETFFSLEAKRLYVSEALKRRHEYVAGYIDKGKYRPCGGIERFKLKLHGRKLQYAGMVGYVQAHDFQYWFKQINQWIEDLSSDSENPDSSWSSEDKLSELAEEGVKASCKSSHKRDGLADIELTHLWIIA
jgi:hypothetical protein